MLCLLSLLFLAVCTNVRTLAGLPLQCFVLFEIMGKARFSFPAVDADFVI